MISRLIFLMLLVVGLAIGPVRGVVACEKNVGVAACHSCCADPVAACCAVSCGAVPEPPPAQSAPTAGDGKQMVTPTLVFVGLNPVLAVERPAVHRRQAARLPVVARLDLICVRLI